MESDVKAVGESVLRERGALVALRDAMARVVLGQERLVERLVMALLADGHVLLEGVPGLAKTTAVQALAEGLRGSFARLQFTPDLLPADLVGTLVYSPKEGDFFVKKGPIFANVVLADEVNRAPAKVQSALLEAMQERQVTIGDETFRLPDPFLVLATQNPIEQEGTYPLPEAQLDRFMFNIQIGYPTEEEEVEIIRRTTSTTESEASPCLTREDVLRVQDLVRQVPIADHVIRYALRLVRATRVKDDSPKPQMVTDYLGWGAGPRAGQYLTLAAKAKAVLGGSLHVTPEHIRAVAKPALRHRIITNFNAEADGVTTDDIIDALLKETPVEASDAGTRRQMDAVMN